MTERALISRDEEIVWKQDARRRSALCPFLSGFRSGCDPCPLPPFHPSCLGSTLGVLPRGRCRIAASAWARQPGSRQAPRHWNEVSQEWIPGRATADQNLALSPLRASQAPSKGQNWSRDPERLGVRVKAKTAKERGLFNLKWQRLNRG